MSLSRDNPRAGVPLEHRRKSTHSVAALRARKKMLHTHLSFLITQLLVAASQSHSAAKF